MDEALTIKNFQKGNEQAFRIFFELFHTRLCYFAGSILNDNKESEDIVQDAFVQLWQKRKDFENIQAVKAFLYITVKNKCLNGRKHVKVVTKYEALFSPESYEKNAMEYAMEAEVLAAINTALQKLPEGCRNILQLSYFQQMKNRDVANHLQLSVNTVKTQKKRALHILRSLLKKSSLWLLVFPL